MSIHQMTRDTSHVLLMPPEPERRSRVGWYCRCWTNFEQATQLNSATPLLKLQHSKSTTSTSPRHATKNLGFARSDDGKLHLACDCLCLEGVDRLAPAPPHARAFSSTSKGLTTRRSHV